MTQSPSEQLQGKIVYRGDAGYEALRRQAIFNGKKPDRYPAAILMAESDADVIAGVRLAKAQGWQVGVRSGGHSWVAPHTRDDALLINISRMREMSVDPEKRIACVSPALTGDIILAKLQEHGLMFPGGHSPTVAVGGFLLCGGHGWNSRAWGPACASLLALDVVTADGELIHASETENSDYLWAARGAGPGFFGVAVRFYLRAYTRPAAMDSRLYAYPPHCAEALVVWLRENGNTFPKGLEVALSGSGADPGLMLSAFGFADSEPELKAMLDLLDSCPVRAEGQLLPPPPGPTGVDLRPYAGIPLPPEDMRYAVDGMWTSAGAAELAPFMPGFFSDYPTPQSMSSLVCWGPVQDLPDMAYSVQGDLYFVVSGNSLEEADDARCAGWAVNAVGRMQALSAGAQLNDDNMVGHKQRYLSEAAAARLQTLRAKYDPQHRFVSFLEG